jgi:hypothetical protein
VKLIAELCLTTHLLDASELVETAGAETAETFDFDFDDMAPPTPPPTAIAIMIRATTRTMKNILRFNPNILLSCASWDGSTAVVAGDSEGRDSSERKTLGASSNITGYLGSCSSKYCLLNWASGFERAWGELSTLTSGRFSSW